jgi:uncharacterized protein (TIGR03437 family)
MSPCSLVTIIAPGIAPGIQGAILPPIFGPLPYQIALGSAGTLLSVTFGGTPAPIYSVVNANGQQQATVQVPCEVTPGNSVAVVVNVGAGNSTVNVPVQTVSPGIFMTMMSDGVMRAVITRPDGSFVSLTNPARRGEILRAYATGLGPATPPVATNSIAVAGIDSIVNAAVIVGFGVAGGGAGGTRVINARIAPDLIGVAEIPFQLPSDTATGNNVAFSIGVVPAGSNQTVYSNTTKIPVQ